MADRQALLDEAARRHDDMKQEAKAIVDSAASGPAVRLGGLDKEMLMFVVAELAGRYKAADGERLELKRLVADAQSARRQYGELQAQYHELEAAHVMQSKLLQKVQKKMAKVDAYADTIKTQEQVIAKMETFIETRLQQSDASTGENHVLYYENERLEVTNEEHVNKIYQLEKRIRELDRVLGQWNRREEELVGREAQVAQAEAMQRQLDVYAAQVQEMDTAIRELTATKDGLERDGIRVGLERDAALDAVTALETKTAAMAATITSLEAGKQALTAENDELRRAAAQAATDRAATDKRRDEEEKARSVAAAAELAALQKEKSDVEKDRDAALKDKERAEKDAERAGKDREKLEAERDKVEQARKKAEEELEKELAKEKGGGEKLEAAERDKARLQEETADAQRAREQAVKERDEEKAKFRVSEEKIARMEHDIEDLQEKCRRLSEEAEASKASKDADGQRIHELEAERIQKDIRITTLEHQVVATAQDFAKKVTALKTQIFEMEMRNDAAGGGGGGEGGVPSGAASRAAKMLGQEREAHRRAAVSSDVFSPRTSPRGGNDAPQTAARLRDTNRHNSQTDAVPAADAPLPAAAP